MTPIIYAFEGVGQTPSHIIGHPDPEVAAVLVSETVVQRLAEVGISAAIVADETYEPDSADTREIPAITFPDVEVLKRRKVGRTALEIIPPLDEPNLEAFNGVIEKIFKPRVVFHKERRITTGQLEQLVKMRDTADTEEIPAQEQRS